MTETKHKFMLSHKRAEHFLIPSTRLIIIGRDTEHVSGAHSLWRADVKTPPDANLLASVRQHGIIQPIRARKLPKGTVRELVGELIEHGAPKQITAADDSYEWVEVVVGRERVKVGRVIEWESGVPFLIPTLVWPAGTPDAEIIGAANAENFMRKTEDVASQAEHVYMQLRAEGYFDGAEKEALARVQASTGFSSKHIAQLLAFREDAALVKAYKQKEIGGTAALSIAMLGEADRAAELEKIRANPELGSVEMVRERVAYRAHTNGNGHSNGHNGNGKSAGKKNGKDGIVISKASLRKIAEQEAAKKPDERNVDDLVLKTLKVCAGLADPKTVPGFMKAWREVHGDRE